MKVMCYDAATGRVIRMRWWHRFTDKEYRQARRKYRARTESELVVVETTDNGTDIAMPSEVKAAWEALTDEDRADFVAAINEQANEERFNRKGQ